jgi:hypothetical protein
MKFLTSIWSTEVAMKIFIVLKGPDQFVLAEELLKELEEEEGLHEVTIKPHHPSLSANQQRLYRLWMKVVSDHTGYTVAECPERYKEKFLCKIYMRDDDEYAKMITSINNIHKDGKKGDAHHLKRMIIRMTSTTTATTKQMSEYLDSIKLDCSTELNLQLPLPEDIGRYHSK